MQEVPWASPQALARCTLSQLLCLGLEKPPEGGETKAEYLARKAAEDRAWQSGRRSRRPIRKRG